MKWIKGRQKFLAEAKIGDVVNPKQKEVITKRWGKKYLEYEEVEPEQEIKAIEGTWKLTPEQKYRVLDLFFKTNIRKAEEVFDNLPTEFIRVVSDALNYALELDDYSNETDKIAELMEDGIDFTNIGLEEIAALTNNVLPRIDVKTTISDKQMVRDDLGVPVKGEDGQFQYQDKVAGEFAYYNGLYNLNSFAKDYDDCVKKLGREDQIVNRNFSSSEIGSIKNMLSTEVKGHQADIKVFHKDAYVSILHNPQDILNISVSKFYASCQEFYGGSHVRSLLANVFDPNSVPAFIYLDSPVYNSDGELIAEKLPLARFFIRKIDMPESFVDPGAPSTKLFFDRVYPQRMSDGENDGIYNMVEQVAGIKRYLDSTDEDAKTAVYVFAPDISSDDNLDSPYHDTLHNIQHKRTIGMNCKFLNITADSDWSDVFVRENNRIETMTISTPKVPVNLFELKYNLEKLSIVNIDITEMPELAKFGTGDIELRECRTNMVDLRKGLEGTNLNKLSLINCDIAGISFEGMQLSELVLKSDIEGRNLADVIANARIKNLVISDHLLMDPENVEFLKSAVASKQIGQWKKEGLLSKKLKNKKK
jgi:hypothetical protein